MPHLLECPMRMPVAYIPHGGGPWPFVDLGLNPAEVRELSAYLRTVADLPPEPPAAILVISAHWEEPTPTVMTGVAPPLFFDYYGFPAASYRLSWPAPGAPALASRVQERLASAGFPTSTDAERGFDHGTFIPFMLAWPDAKIPTLQLSLKQGLDPAEHLRIGRALAPLRDEGVFLVGSGMSYHNMRGFGNPEARPASEAFDRWLGAAVAADDRDAQLTAWTQAPAARLVHPREEHLLPLMVAAGAAGADRGRVAFSGTMMGVRISAVHFG